MKSFSFDAVHKYWMNHSLNNYDEDLVTPVRSNFDSDQEPMPERDCLVTNLKVSKIIKKWTEFKPSQDAADKLEASDICGLPFREPAHDDSKPVCPYCITLSQDPNLIGPACRECYTKICDLPENNFSKAKKETDNKLKALEQANSVITEYYDQINRANHQLELKQAEIKNLEKKLEEQALTLSGYIESNIRLESQNLRPCNCLIKTEIACESFRQTTNQTLIRWATTCLIVLAILTYYMYPKI